jgi:hypothetical protein
MTRRVPFNGDFIGSDGSVRNLDEFFNGGGVPEAPADGEAYVRRDGEWVPLQDFLYPVAWAFKFIGYSLHFSIHMEDKGGEEYSPPMDFQIDWGDGSPIAWASADDLSMLEHEYSEAADEYVVRIVNYKSGWIDITSADGQIEFLTPFLPQVGRKDFSEAFTEGELSYIPDAFLAGCPDLEIAEDMFAFFAGAAIPEDLFAYCPNLQDISRCFSGSKLVSIPENLFANNYYLQNAANAFEDMQQLASIPDGLFTTGNNPSMNRFDDTFRYSNPDVLTGPAPDLWNRYPNADGTRCFFGAISLSNYAAIPDGWK